MKRTPKTPAEITAFAIALIASLVNILMRMFSGFHYSMIASLIGIGFAIAFLQNLKLYNTLFYAWALTQLIIIKFPVSGKEFDLSQVLSLGTGMQFNLKQGYFYLGIGFPGIALTALAVKLKMDSIFGAVFTLKSLKKESFLADFLPAKVKIIRRVKMGDNEGWFVAELFEKTPVMYGLIAGKEENMIRSGKNQVIQFLKVDDPAPVLNANALDKRNYKTGAWAIVE